MVQCSAGIDFVPSDIITLNPQQTSNLTFNMHSVYTIGKINKCDGDYTPYIYNRAIYIYIIYMY